MDEQLPGASRPASGWTHDWYPLDDYENLHHSHMNRLESEGIILSHSLVFTLIESHDGEPQAIHVEGRIECAHDVVVEVDKWLEMRRGRQNRPEVRGFSYSYHAWRAGSRVDVLRYDSSHGLEALHRHYFDVAGNEVTVRDIALADLPTLAAVVEEAVAIAATGTYGSADP